MSWYEWPWLEWAGIATATLCVWLCVRQNLWTWPIGIANNVLFIALFVPRRLYADSALQVVYIVLGLYGWWHWLRGNPAERDSLPVRPTPRREAVGVALVAAAAFGAMGWFLDSATDTDVPWYDAFPTVTSLVAQYLLTRKYLETWWGLILLVNVPYIALYSAKDLPYLAAFQLVLISLSYAGWREWRQTLRPRAPVLAEAAS